MTRPDLSGIPEALARRPIDPRRGLPVPVANMIDADTWDFTVISGEQSLRLGKAALCALCEQPLGNLAAFLGGAPRPEMLEKEESMAVYSDPPMHEDCAVAATRLCPHIRIQHAKRATEHRVAEAAGQKITQGPNWRHDKPADWVMTIWRGYGMTLVEGVICYVPGLVPQDGGYVQTPPVRTRTWRYDNEGTLHEVPE